MIGDRTEEVTKVGEWKRRKRRKDEGTRESKGSFKKVENTWLIKT